MADSKFEGMDLDSDDDGPWANATDAQEPDVAVLSDLMLQGAECLDFDFGLLDWLATDFSNSS